MRLAVFVLLVASLVACRDAEDTQVSTEDVAADVAVDATAPRFTELEDRIETLESTVADLESAKSDLESELSEAQRKQSYLETEVESLRAQIGY